MLLYFRSTIVNQSPKCTEIALLFYDEEDLQAFLLLVGS
jgi:hypothetical protein